MTLKDIKGIKTKLKTSRELKTSKISDGVKDIKKINVQIFTTKEIVMYGPLRMME